MLDVGEAPSDMVADADGVDVDDTVTRLAELLGNTDDPNEAVTEALGDPDNPGVMVAKAEGLTEVLGD